MSIALPLSQILALVGKLDDAPGDETPRERFRRFLKENVREVGQVRDYVEECLRSTGDQYNRALQDLVNYLGYFLGFEVTFGRYQGVHGQIGFDGHWTSPTGFHIVIEVKTTDVYAIKAATLVGYIDGLISEKAISSWDHALGLYVVGRPEAELRQLENAIVAERRTHQLRIISTESLLSLAEMMSEYKVPHEEILALLRPSGPKIDPIVDLMTRLVAERRFEKFSELEKEPSLEGEGVYRITPIKSDEEGAVEEEIIHAEQQNRGRLQSGQQTPLNAYFQPILTALDELGGSARAREVLKRLEQSMKGILKKVDYELLKSGGLRWHKEANFARLSMVKMGLLKEDSQYWLWEITEAGRTFLKKEASDRGLRRE